MRGLKTFPEIAEMFKGKYSFQNHLEFVRALLQENIGYDCFVTDGHVGYLHQCAIRHTPIDPRAHAIDCTAKVYGVSTRHVRKIVTDIR
jgi:hypothetical protein